MPHTIDGKPAFYAEIDDTDPGITAIAIVTKPAIQEATLMLSESGDLQLLPNTLELTKDNLTIEDGQVTRLSLPIQLSKSKEHQIVYGKVLVPDLAIYRDNLAEPGGQPGEGYLIFTKDTIQKLYTKFSQNPSANQLNLNHISGYTVNGRITQTWLSGDGTIDVLHFENTVPGTWIAVAKIDDPMQFDMIKNMGDESGFSIEAITKITRNMPGEAGSPAPQQLSGERFKRDFKRIQNEEAIRAYFNKIYKTKQYQNCSTFAKLKEKLSAEDGWEFWDKAGSDYFERKYNEIPNKPTTKMSANTHSEDAEVQKGLLQRISAWIGLSATPAAVSNAVNQSSEITLADGSRMKYNAQLGAGWLIHGKTLVPLPATSYTKSDGSKIELNATLEAPAYEAPIASEPIAPAPIQAAPAQPLAPAVEQAIPVAAIVKFGDYALEGGMGTISITEVGQPVVLISPEGEAMPAAPGEYTTAEGIQIVVDENGLLASEPMQLSAEQHKLAIIKARNERVHKLAKQSTNKIQMAVTPVATIQGGEHLNNMSQFFDTKNRIWPN